MLASVATGYLVRRFAPHAFVFVYVGIQAHCVNKPRAAHIVWITKQADDLSL
jgi:hypothetical protein